MKCPECKVNELEEPIILPTICKSCQDRHLEEQLKALERTHQEKEERRQEWQRRRRG